MRAVPQPVVPVRADRGLVHTQHAYRRATVLTVNPDLPTIEHLESRCLLSADLGIALPAALPGNLPPAGKNKLAVVVSNVGDEQAAGLASVRLYASTDAAWDVADALLASVSKQMRIQPLKQKTVKLSFASPTGLADGDYHLIAVVDGGTQIVEANTANNAAFSTSLVGIRQPFVDLTGQFASVPAGPIIFRAGREAPVKLKLQVTNNGNVAAKGPVVADVYVSFSPTLDSNSRLITTTPARMLNIKAGKSKTIGGTLYLPTNTQSGDVYFLCVFNTNNGIVESNTANNTVVSAQKVTLVNVGAPAGARLGGPLSSSIDTVVVDNAELVRFTVGVDQTDANSVVQVDELDAQGNRLGVLTRLYDNGSAANQDGIAGDGVFNGVSTIGFDQPGRRFFVGRVVDSRLSGELVTPTIDFDGVALPSIEQGTAELQSIQSMNQLARNVIAGGGSAEQSLDAVAASLQTDANVRQGSIQRSAGVLQWTTRSGITHVMDTTLTTDDDELGGTAPATIAPVQSAGESYAPTAAEPLAFRDTSKSAVLFSPFAWQIGSRDPTPAISSMLGAKGYSVTTYVNSAQSDFHVAIESWEELGRYGVVALTTHGAVLPNGTETFNTGEVMDPELTANLILHFVDLITKRLMVSSFPEGGLGDQSYYAITPAFISRYTGGMNHSIVYAGACNSLKSGTMAKSFLNTGAAAYIGFDNKVSQSFNHNKAEVAFQSLLKDDHNKVSEIPGIRTVRDPKAPNAVFTYVGDPDATLPGPDLLADYTVYVRYSWPQTKRDLDTNTTFLGAKAGWSLGGGPYLLWNGDDTSAGGSETVRVDIAQAFNDGKWSTSTTIGVGADWYTSAGGSGPAIVTVALENQDGELSSVFTKTISPGQESHGSTSQAGVVTVSLGGDLSAPLVSIVLATT